MAADRHLLIGVLALQNGLIQPAHVVAAFHAWTGDKARSLVDHLMALGDFHSIDAMTREPALDPLRDRPDFRLLMLDLAFPADPFAHGD